MSRRESLGSEFEISESLSVNCVLGEGPRSSVLAIIAALNEEEGIGPTIEELRSHLDNVRVLIVDGRSVDRTVDVAKSLYADVVFQGGKGKGNAIMEAIKSVIADVDFVVFTDADYTYPARYIPKMIRILEENPNIGMVCGNRFNQHLDARAMHNIFYIGNRFLAFTHNLLNGIALRDPLTGLRVVRWEILKGWSPRSKDFDIEVELNHHVERKGYDIVEVDVDYRPRLGEKKLKLKHGAVILKRMLLESAYQSQIAGS
jgi:dolichol-phosphate mannosyltransferase